MKKQILAMTALAAATLATAASAADLPRNNYYSQPAPGSYYNWAGWYAGAIVGYEWGKVPGTSTPPSGVPGGLPGARERQRPQAQGQGAGGQAARKEGKRNQRCGHDVRTERC